ncbi:GNAT family N-acetyltransferase [Paenibacillus sp. SYP-B4298]|uniref:GNAT family N-acetyltransferase n=1 Tax=Paenibacillus sp. SYP-B4298 TaxID=2996034 RepID=UPI0022DDC0D6|nr:GNAT family N-acetyltransferase [Paenibacillus sp. SYP-B4298]
MNVHIREAASKDVPALSYLMSHLLGREVLESDMHNRLQFVDSSRYDELYVYEMEDKVVGVLGFRIREQIEEVARYGEISVLAVDPECKRQGIGRQLVAFAEQLALQHGCKGTWLVSGYKREQEAYVFYEQQGYQRTGTRFVKPLSASEG